MLYRSQKRTVYARVYINFDFPQLVLSFKNAFDGHVFVSSRGTQYKCTVEYAPYQKIPRNGKVKKDPREGTLERGGKEAASILSIVILTMSHLEK